MRKGNVFDVVACILQGLLIKCAFARCPKAPSQIGSIAHAAIGDRQLRNGGLTIKKSDMIKKKNSET